MPGDLADGWGPVDPQDDTLMRAGVLSLADRVRHHAAALDREALDDGRWVAAALAERGMFSNAGIVVRPPDDWSWVAPGLTDLAPRGVPKLLISPFPTPDLRGEGLELVGHPPFMIRPAGGIPPEPIPGLEVREVLADARPARVRADPDRGLPDPGHGSPTRCRRCSGPRSSAVPPTRSSVSSMGYR